jgi:chromosome segregation ATPase
MPDSTIPNAAKSEAPAPIAARGTAPNSTAAPAIGLSKAGSGPRTLAVAMGSLCAVFVVTTVVFWGEAGDRDKSLVERQNRLEQTQAAVAVLETQVALDKTAIARIQKRMDEVKAESVLRVSESDKIKAGDADLQSELDKTRVIATDYETQMENAKVASIKHQGDVEVAHSQTAIMQERMDKIEADSAQVQAQLVEAKAANADLQDKLDKERELVAGMQKIPAKS